MRTFKHHFIAGLCEMHDDFPLYLWEDLLEQATITINLLRSSRQHPHLSAYHSLFGAFDFNRTPLAPPGIKIIALTPSTMRGAWEAHGKEASTLAQQCNIIDATESTSLQLSLS